MERGSVSEDDEGEPLEPCREESERTCSLVNPCDNFVINSTKAKPRIRWCKHVLLLLLDEGQVEEALGCLEDLEPLVGKRFATMCGLEELYQRLLPREFAVPRGKNKLAFSLLKSAYPLPDVKDSAMAVLLWNKAVAPGGTDSDLVRTHFRMLLEMACHPDPFFFAERDINRCLERLAEHPAELSTLPVAELKAHLKEVCRLGNASATPWSHKVVESARPSEEAAAKLRIALLQIMPTLSAIAKHILKCHSWPDEAGEDAWWRAALASKGLTASTKPSTPDQDWDLFVTCSILCDHEEAVRSFFEHHSLRRGSEEPGAAFSQATALLQSLSAFRNDEAHSDVPLFRYRKELAGLSTLLALLAARSPSPDSCSCSEDAVQQHLQQAGTLGVELGGLFERELTMRGEEPKTSEALVLQFEQEAQLRLAMACNRFELALSPVLQEIFESSSPDAADALATANWWSRAQELYCNGHRPPEMERYFSPGHVWSTDILLSLANRKDKVDSLPLLDRERLRQAKELVAEGRHNKPLRLDEVTECLTGLAYVLEAFGIIQSKEEVLRLRSCAVRVPHGQLAAQRVSNPTFGEKVFTGRRAVLETIGSHLSPSDEESRNVLLTGNPGYGKSAIAAQIERHGALNTKALVIGAHHCYRQIQDTTTVAGFLHSLVTSLRRALSSNFELLTGRLLSSSIEGHCLHGSSIVRQICDALKEEPPSDMLRLIVIDGLDEATPLEGAPVQGETVAGLVAQLGRELPHRCAIVATSRPCPSIEEEFVDDAWVAVPVSHSEEAIADVVEFVQHLRSTDPRYADAVADDQVDDLAQRSEGNFLVTKQVLDEAVLKGTTVQLEHFVPKTASHHLRSFRERFGMEAEQFGDARKLLEILAARGGPLSKENLFAVLRSSAAKEGLPHPYSRHDHFYRVWRKLQPFLSESNLDSKDSIRGDEGDSDHVGKFNGDVVAYHSSLLEWLQDESCRHPFLISAERGHRMLARAALGLQDSATDLPPDCYLLAGLFHCSLAGDAQESLMELARRSCEGRDGDMPASLESFCTASSLELWMDLGMSPRAYVGSWGLFHYACFLAATTVDLRTVQRFLRANEGSNHPLWSLRTRGRTLTPLHCAVLSAPLHVVEELLGAGAPCFYEDCDEQPLHFSIPRGPKFMELLITHGAPLTPTADGRSLLHIAAASGEDEAVSLLLSKGIAVDCCSNSGCSPLHEAARQGHRSTVELLLSSGASDRVACNTTALGHAAGFGFIDVVALMLDRGASPNALEEEISPLAAAAQAGGAAVVELLVERGADVNGGKLPPLHIAAAFGHTVLAKRLIELGADKSAFLGSRLALQQAALRGHVSTVCALLEIEKECERNYVFPMCVAGLHAACEGGQVALVEFFLDQGIEVDQVNTRCETPIFSAFRTPEMVAQEDLIAVLRCLYARGADFSHEEPHGRTLLHCAAALDPPTVLEYLLAEHNFDIEAPDCRGFRPLHYACHSRRQAAAAILIEAGADASSACGPYTRGFTFVGSAAHFMPDQPHIGLELSILRWAPRGTPLHLAVWNNVDTAVPALIELLVEAGAPVDAMAKADGLGLETALLCAIEAGNVDNVEALLQCGASWDLPDGGGRYPLAWAALSGSQATVAALCEAGAGEHFLSCLQARGVAYQREHTEVFRYLRETPAIKDKTFEAFWAYICKIGCVVGHAFLVLVLVLVVFPLQVSSFALVTLDPIRFWRKFTRFTVTYTAWNARAAWTALRTQPQIAPAAEEESRGVLFPLEWGRRPLAAAPS